MRLSSLIGLVRRRAVYLVCAQMQRFFTILATILGMTLLTGCSNTIPIAGAYFPAWLLSILIGLLVTSILNFVFFRIGLDPWIKPRAIAYPAMALFFTLITYLIFFR
jgi:hypothetical protein